jgi:thiol-disulfide isomerase/thioredoxin
MKPKLLKLSFSIVLLLSVFNIAGAQQKKKKHEIAYSIVPLKKAVEDNPESLEAHHAYLGAAGADTAAKQYAIWIRRFPKSATVCFALGEYYHQCEQGLKGQPYLAMAVKHNPKLAKAWDMMAQTATDYNENWARTYASKAIALEPNNPAYAYTYAYSFKNTDSLKYNLLMLNLANRFRGTEPAIIALYRLINNTSDNSKKDFYYKATLGNPPAHLSTVFDNQMIDYYNFLLLKDTQRAIQLAAQMAADKKHALRLNDWQNRQIAANNFVKANNFIETNKPDSALALLNTISVSKYTALYNAYTTLKARAANDSNNVQLAYNNLLREYSKLPSDDVRQLLMAYGLKLGYSEDDVINKVWEIRDSSAIIATDFRLKAILTDDSLSLTNYRGKVVLLTYWFPGCGPCRAEFSNFEKVIKKVNNKNLVYLGLNVEPLQDRQVLPMMQTNNYTFIPLHDSWARPKGTLAAPFAPSNYLIDQQGRILFSDFTISTENERSLELMITELLNRKPKFDLPKSNLDTAVLLLEHH